MKYLILIHQNRGAREQFASFPPEVQAAGMQAYYDLNAELDAHRRDWSAQRRSATTARPPVLSLKSGSVVTSDGPFAESKEMLAGFYLVDVTSLDRALEIAAQIPEVQAGAGDVEVRAVMDTAAMA